MTEAVQDETTPCKFRHLLKANGLNKLFFDAIIRVKFSISVDLLRIIIN